MMKYFSRKWALEMEDDEQKDIRDDYWQHIASLTPSLPLAIKKLSRLRLHDGLIRWVIFMKGKKQLQISLLCGDVQNGYFDLDLIYSGIQIKYFNINEFAKLSRDRRTQLLYDEIDIYRKRYIHRILFYPDGEIEIRFEKLHIKKTERTDRHIGIMYDPFIIESRS